MPTALITGASAGLGLEFAKLFAKDRYDIVLVARRKERLEEIGRELSSKHGIKVHSIGADLGEAGAPAAIALEVQKLNLEIDCLVNNAGLGLGGRFSDNDPARDLNMIAVNVTSLTALTQLFLPSMVKRGRGRILNLGSTAGYQPGPFMTTYYATKAYVNSFSEALAYELKGTGVTCTLSCPGATETEFAKVAGIGESRLFQMGAMSAPAVAEEAYRAMHAGRRVIVHGIKNKLGALSAGWTPNAILLPLVATLNNDTNPKKLKS